MSKLENAVTTLIDLFKEYSAKEGKKGQLCAAEFKALLEAELSTPELKAKFNPEDVDSLVKELDKNGDDQINFREFCRFVSQLAKSYYRLGKAEAREAREAKEKK